MNTATGKELLEKAAEAKSCQQIADELGVSRSAVSLVLRGKYPGRPEKIYRRAEEVYGMLECPFLRKPITFLQCHDYHTREMPEDRAGVRHWRACKSCDLKGKGHD